MEFLKKNEQYTFTKVLEDKLSVEGTVTKHECGTIQFLLIFLRHNKDSEEIEDQIGEVYYIKYNNSQSEINCSALEEDRITLLNYADSLIKEGLLYFN